MTFFMFKKQCGDFKVSILSAMEHASSASSLLCHISTPFLVKIARCKVPVLCG